MASHALLYYTHVATDAVKSELNALVDACASNSGFIMFAAGCCDNRMTLSDLATDKIAVKSYVRDDLRDLPYKSQLARVDWKTMRYSADLAIMRFFRDHPDFDYYWIVEYDVRFTGSWASFIADLKTSEADLLCSYVTQYHHSPDWMHWGSFSSGNELIGKENLVRAFFPVARLSKSLMRTIDERCERGWAGQYEVLWTTIAKTANGKIEEIGGVGSAVPPIRHGKYYNYMMAPNGLFLSTFGAWPSYSLKSSFHTSSIKNILWHPVKE